MDLTQRRRQSHTKEENTVAHGPGQVEFMDYIVYKWHTGT